MYEIIIFVLYFITLLWLVSLNRKYRALEHTKANSSSIRDINSEIDSLRSKLYDVKDCIFVLVHAKMQWSISDESVWTDYYFCIPHEGGMTLSTDIVMRPSKIISVELLSSNKYRMSRVRIGNADVLDGSWPCHSKWLVPEPLNLAFVGNRVTVEIARNVEV